MNRKFENFNKIWIIIEKSLNKKTGYDLQNFLNNNQQTTYAFLLNLFNLDQSLTVLFPEYIQKKRNELENLYNTCKYFDEFLKKIPKQLENVEIVGKTPLNFYMSDDNIDDDAYKEKDFKKSKESSLGCCLFGIAMICLVLIILKKYINGYK